MNLKKSLEEIEKTLLDLKEKNKNTPILVEGDKDIEALKKLGVDGEILSVNKGITLTDFCDRISQEYKDIIILTDWDRKGGHLCHIIRKNLEGRVYCNTRFRELFARHSMIRTVEGLPSWLQTMKEKLNLI